MNLRMPGRRLRPDRAFRMRAAELGIGYSLLLLEAAQGK
jgi:hypothetical protein